ncbi:hypothetical protein BD779DRAFT_1788247 [Infundibulicybe gibba]|nr:hypothetical protein BD779DRAFT_1788247 [Infundibulicybe gibba]
MVLAMVSPGDEIPVAHGGCAGTLSERDHAECHRRVEWNHRGCSDAHVHPAPPSGTLTTVRPLARAQWSYARTFYYQCRAYDEFPALLPLNAFDFDLIFTGDVTMVSMFVYKSGSRFSISGWEWLASVLTPWEQFRSLRDFYIFFNCTNEGDDHLHHFDFYHQDLVDFAKRRDTRDHDKRWERVKISVERFLWVRAGTDRVNCEKSMSVPDERFAAHTWHARYFTIVRSPDKPVEIDVPAGPVITTISYPLSHIPPQSMTNITMLIEHELASSRITPSGHSAEA